MCCGEGPAGQLDAAAYDRGSDAWRPIDGGPLRDVTRASGVWTGDRWLVAGDGRLASYEPTSDQWQELLSAATAWRGEAAVAWTGTQLAVWPPSPDGLLLYDPAIGAWSTPPEPDLPLPTAPSLIWSGEELLVFGQSSEDETATA